MTPARTRSPLLRRRLPAVAVLVTTLVAGCTSTPAAEVSTTPTPSSVAAPPTTSTSTRDTAAEAQARAAQEKAAAAAKEKAAREKAAREKAARAKAAQEKAAREKAARAKAAREKAARAEAAKRKAAAELARRRLAAIDPLTGGRRSDNPVVAVKLDNTSAGRPQFGIQAADVVAVEQVEGGLTRIIALFHSKIPAEVGPVRSVRSTDTDFLPMFGRPLLVFSGGAGGPLARLAGSRVIDASSLGGTFRSSARPAPYNLHASLPSIIAAQKARQGGKPFDVQRPGFEFAAVTPAFRRYKVMTQVDVVMSAGRTSFSWSTRNDAYRVEPAGRAGVSADGTPLYANNVLVQRVTDVPDGTVDTNGQPSLLSRTVGRGTFQLFRNGRIITGTWSRPSVGSPTRYYDSQGGIAKFSPGRTWLMLVPQTGSVRWTQW